MSGCVLGCIRCVSRCVRCARRCVWRCVKDGVSRMWGDTFENEVRVKLRVCQEVCQVCWGVSGVSGGVSGVSGCVLGCIRCVSRCARCARRCVWRCVKDGVSRMWGDTFENEVRVKLRVCQWVCQSQR